MCITMLDKLHGKHGVVNHESSQNYMMKLPSEMRALGTPQARPEDSIIPRGMYASSRRIQGNIETCYSIFHVDSFCKYGTLLSRLILQIFGC